MLYKSQKQQKIQTLSYSHNILSKNNKKIQTLIYSHNISNWGSIKQRIRHKLELNQ